MMTYEFKIMVKDFLSPKTALNLIDGSYISTLLAVVKETFVSVPFVASFVAYILFLLAVGIFSKKKVGNKKVRLITENVFWLILFSAIIIPAIIIMLYALLLSWVG